MSSEHSWNAALRALRTARGVSQDRWAAQLGYSRRTLQRWEQGDLIPDAAAEAAVVAHCEEQGLFRAHDCGPLAGVAVSASWLHDRLAAARLDRTATAAARAPLRAVLSHTSQTAAPNNLPLQLTSFIGREQEIAEIVALLATSRLLSLTGPGGVGKTRLALAVAEQAQARYPDGVLFVDLSGIADPAGVMPAMAQVLGVTERGGRTLAASLAAHLREKRLLLLVDNFEQVVEAAPMLHGLLLEAPHLTLLVTSRMRLRVAGEREYVVPPLPLPDSAMETELDRLSRNPAIQLFVERAEALQFGFSLTAENALPLGELCRQLDGLPLAIELAAARIKLLPPAALLARLGRRLSLLSGGARSLPARQQTLRATIAWSWDLLTATEQAVFRRLAVFAGGWTLEAAEVVCNPEGELDVMEALASLIDKSLVRRDEASGHVPRLRLLEIIRAFAWEQLETAGEVGSVRRRHAAYYLALAEDADRHHHGAQRHRWHDRLEGEHDNLRAALAWSAEVGETETELRLATALLWFWLRRGHWREGRVALEAAADRAMPSSTAPEAGAGPCRGERLRASALASAGTLAWQQGDLAAAGPLLERAVKLAGALDERRTLAHASKYLGLIAFYQGDHAAARPLLERSVALLRKYGDRWLLADALFVLGDALPAADEARAAALYEESLALYRALDDPLAAQPLTSLGHLALRRGDTATARSLLTDALRLRRLEPDRMQLALSLAALGEVARREDQPDEARELFEEALRLSRERGQTPSVAWALCSLGQIASRQGKNREGSLLLGESLRLASDIDQKARIAACLVGLGGIAGADGRFEQAARFLGAADAVCDGTGSPLEPADQVDHDRILTLVRSTLGEEAADRVTRTARTLPLAQVVTEAFAYAGQPPHRGAASTS